MKVAVLSLAVAALALGACTGADIGASAASTVISYTLRPTEPPADTRHQIPRHESWCYSTLGETQCYTKAQPVDPGRLVSVDPENVYPLTPEAYRDEVAGKRSAKGAPTPVAPQADSVN